MEAPPAPKKARRSEVSRMQDESVLCDDDEEDSPFTLYFVDLPNEPTVKEIRNLEELFKTAKAVGIMPEWIDSDALEDLQKSEDFFVLPCFRGKLFRKLQARKLKVYGPPIVLESIEDGKQLPQWNHPVYSSVFQDVKISFTGLNLTKKQELYEKIGWMCGVVGDALYHETTHLVTEKAEQTEKYKAAVNNSIKLMRIGWIDDLWETSQTTMGRFSALSRDSVNSYALRVFEGLEMAITSIDGADRTNFIQLIEDHGGKVPGTMSKTRCSYLISDKITGVKYAKAVEWKSMQIVQSRWIRKCVDLGHLVDAGKYHPKYLTADHIRSSTPKRDANVTESVPDISSIAGHGGRLGTSSFNSSIPQMDQSYQHQSGSSFISFASTSKIPSSTFTNNDSTLGRSGSGVRDGISTPIARVQTTPLIRYPTTQTASVQNIADVISDPIDELRKNIDDGLGDLFENCMFYICGVDESRMEKWRRFLNETGATRVAKFTSATNVVVVSPNQQERITIRKHLHQEDIAIVTVGWVVECVKQRKMISVEGYQWTENTADESQSSQSQLQPVRPQPLPRTSSKSTIPYGKTSGPSSTSTQVGIFSYHTYCVHCSVDQEVSDDLKEKIPLNGGKLMDDPDYAEFVIFGHSGPMHELISFDAVVTDFYIYASIGNNRFLNRSCYPLFVPLPRPPILIFNQRGFQLKCKDPFLRDRVRDIIEDNGGRIVEQLEPKDFIIMIDAEDNPPRYHSRTLDFSWIIASVSRCRLQPIDNFLYKNNTRPLSGFQRDDDLWEKCSREKNNSTQEMEVEVEDRHRVQDLPVETGNGNIGDMTTPYVNPYFPDLRKPYTMNLQLDGVSEYINNMESPARETQETLTTSRVGSILRKAVVNTGRNEDFEDEPSTCHLIRPRVPENRKTVSSTPVLVRDVNRSMRYMPMDESFADQNQEHEDLNRRYAMNPRFLLSVSNMDPQRAADLQETIMKLGGTIEREFNKDVTHLIASNMQRAPKVLCSIAAGKWCLTPDYVTKSAEVGRWLDEKSFEWTREKLLACSKKNESLKERDSRKVSENLAAVCGLWRQRVAEMPVTFSVSMENRQNGAFSDWRCVIHLDDKRAGVFSSILEAGGAIVHSISEYVEVSTLKPNIVLASKEFPWNPQSAVLLKRDNIPIYVFDILYDFLIDRDNLNRTKFWHNVYMKA
ncbi:BRCT domain-containing protein [Caenorhabditis elegans]|uniref:BRCT domain-containing protein n=1 Tax=Caenorhabditis elegans TaxID=6239 RepID=Q20129_CAEEL|nr:BRCT domain-containing protein [Caenorhabditis elegans]CAA99847.3 BRCT domain-containing protein [Caenorhabditis elegans]|eukprot:NP_492743.3 Uncharacterized protein CELE_F37D6.1 [Caenorhabditis elegans]